QHRAHHVPSGALAPGPSRASHQGEEIGMMAGATDTPMRTRADEVAEPHEELDEEGSGVALRVVLDRSDDIAGKTRVGNGVGRLGPIQSLGRIDVIASGKLEKGGRDSNSETFHGNPAGERIPPGRA